MTTLAHTAGLAKELRLEPGLRPRLLGGQFQLWSEYVHTWGRAEYQLWPRGSALAQQLWRVRSARRTPWPDWLPTSTG
uniref:family 20 glycosylhydrolase n=1 Tax=Tessaracoccus coleopterorum TaxID=2714950 RepID=UPI0022B234A1|nr:family 20 glycosylhydrolase [Tessaracoccus coleopterorum]